jgi:hypothetical protein
VKEQLTSGVNLPIMFAHQDEGWRSHQPAYPWQGGIHASGMWSFRRQTSRKFASPPRLNAMEGFMSKNISLSFREDFSALLKSIPFDEHNARQEIEARNSLRRENHLPVLNADQELRKMQAVAAQEHFDRFCSANWEQAEKEALKDWEPRGAFSRLEAEALIRRVLLRWYNDER